MTIAYGSVHRGTNMSYKLLAFVMVLILTINLIPNQTITVSAMESQSIGKEVAIFLGGAIVGGVVYDGVKWGFLWATASLTPFGQAAILAILAVAGIAAFAVYMLNKDEVNYVTDSVGCILSPDATNWICPYRVEPPKLESTGLAT